MLNAFLYLYPNCQRTTMMINLIKRGRIPSLQPPGNVLVEVNGFEPMASPLVKRDALDP